MPGSLKPLLAGTAAVAAIVLLCWQVRAMLAPADPRAAARDFFVDEATLAFEPHTARELPPIAGRGGPVVIARCFAGDGGRVIGWLERYPEAVKAELEQEMAKAEPDPWVLVRATASREVRSPEPGSPWVAVGSPEGKRITVPPKRADGSSASPVMPSE